MQPDLLTLPRAAAVVKNTFFRTLRAVNLSKIDQSSTRSGNYTCAHLIKS